MKNDIVYIGKKDSPRSNFAAKKTGEIEEIKIVTSKASRKPTRVWEMSNMRETVKDPHALLQNVVRSDDPNLNFENKKDERFEKTFSTNQSVPNLDYLRNEPSYNEPINN